MLLIDASNIGGGACVLLDYLSTSLSYWEVEHQVLCADRVTNVRDCYRVTRPLAPFSLKRQLLLDRYVENLRPNHLLCFGNIPPLRRPNVKFVSTYFHNALLLPKIPRAGICLKIRAQQLSLRMLIKFAISNSDYWILQSSYIRDVFVDEYRVPKDQCRVFPFFRNPIVEDVLINNDGYDFLYVSNLAGHKNHKTLFEAVNLCAAKGFFPRVACTIDVTQNRELTRLISEGQAIGSQIDLLGSVSQNEAYRLTAKCKNVIFPSVIETLGLGLVEAANLGKRVLASDLPWIHEIIKPSLVFDPYSPESISAAILKALQSPELRPSELITKDKVRPFVEWLTNPRF